MLRRINTLEQQLGRLKAQVRQAQQLAGLGTLAATIAHEVNNLLTPILSYARSALNSNDSELGRKALEVTCRNVELLVSMTERVLTVTAAAPTRVQAVGVRSAAMEAAESLCRDFSKDGIVFQVDVEDHLQAFSDPLHLRQVFFNLFINARGAMKDRRSGRLTVSARSVGGRVLIEVRDTGSGIDPDLLPYVFDPLQSSKPLDAAAPRRCSGLGLALCRDLIQEHQGTITVESRPGSGTTFHIELPASENPTT